MAFLSIGGVALPCPIQLTVNDELIWSANTGRTANGQMVGDVVAQKKKLEITWGILKEFEYLTIKKQLKTGFFPITFQDDGVEMTISGYRGTIKKEVLGYVGDGHFYYKSASVELIEQ